MISIYITFAIIALIFSAMILGIASDCKQFQGRLNELKKPIIDDNFNVWLDKQVKQAFDENRNRD